MKIFYGNDDYRQFGTPSKYAFLNWWMDNGCGENCNPYQHVFDNYTMGTAFLGNALLSLNDIVESGNCCNVADKLIFPILFNTWHGLELWLKSSISAFRLLVQEERKNIFGHEIISYTKELNELLHNYGCHFIISKALNSLNLIINEFDRVNAHFDFARYSFDNKGKYQFYNAPYGSNQQWQTSNNRMLENIVPNTCVDIYGLFQLLADVFQNFGAFVEYLTLCISEGGIISDVAYQNYLAAIESSEESFKKYDSQESTVRDVIIKAIMG